MSTPPPTAAPLTPDQLLERLRGMLPAQLDELALKVGITDYVPTDTVANRRYHLATWAGTPGNQRRLLAALPAAADPWAWWRHHRERRRHTQVLGLRTGDSSFSLALDDLFVELELRHADPAREHFAELGLRGARCSPMEQAQDLDSALAAAREDRARFGYRGVVLVGLPGCGKTTLLQHHLVGSTEKAPAMLLRCATLQELGIASLGPGDLVRWAEAEARREQHAGAATALLARRDLPWRFLLDGFDELQSPDDRKAVARWLADEIPGWECAEFVLTTRKATWDHREEHTPLDALLPSFVVLALTTDARDRYVSRWFPLVAEREAGLGASRVLRERARQRGQEQAHELVTRVLGGPDGHARARIERLAGNPLTLSILCLVFREFGKLPDHRGDLYARCFEVLVRGAKVGEARSGLEPEQGVRLLGPLAWQMQASSDDLESPKEMPWDSVLAALDRARDGDPRTRALSADTLFRILREGCGLLVSPDRQQVHFAHLTFQEHLAFRHAREEGLIADLVAQAHDPRWREPILLGMSDRVFRRSFFAGLLATPGRMSALADLVRQCAREAEEPPAEPFVALLSRASKPQAQGLSLADLALALELFRSSAPEIIRAAAAGLATHEDPTVRRLARELAGLPPEQDARPVTRWTVEALGMEFVRVEAGSFLMGASKEPGPGHDPEAYSDEGPPHPVTLTQPFGLGRFPVTNAQYRRYVQARGAPEPGSFRQPGFDDPDMPVTGVSWEDAVGYCAWASAVSGVDVRLPTEAEWEWAARGPRGARFPWGSEPAPDLEHAWYGAFGWDTAAKEWKPELGEHRDRVRGPAVVGGRPAGASVCGAEDLAGNVWEWCQDGWRDKHPSGAELDPCFDAPAASDRVVRGGSWLDDAEDLRCSCRDWLRPSLRDDDLGFRVVCVPARERSERGAFRPTGHFVDIVSADGDKPVALRPLTTRRPSPPPTRAAPPGPCRPRAGGPAPASEGRARCPGG